MKRTLISGITLGFLAAVGTTWTAITWPVQAQENSSQASTDQELQAETTQTQLRETGDMVLGAQDAPVTIVEYASFTCPHCASFHKNVFPELKQNYIDTGKAKFVLREVYFDRGGLWGGMLARCGGEGKYFGIVDLLFEKQADWGRSEDANETAQKLYTIGRSAGMIDDQMAACMQDTRFAEALVAAYQTNMAADDVQGTPTIFINGEKLSNPSFENLAAAIESELPG